MESKTRRVVTFDASKNERIVIIAGKSARDQRTVYEGDVTGRHAVVPVDELVEHKEVEIDEATLDASELQMVGQPVGLGEHGEHVVTLAVDGQEVERMDQRGAYGLLWIPFED